MLKHPYNLIYTTTLGGKTFHENEWFDDFFFIFVGFFPIGTFFSNLLHTVWSINDGLSGNLWKPPETGRGGFRQVSGFFINKKILKKNYTNKKFGNQLETSAAGLQRFPAGFWIIHHRRTFELK